MPWRKFPWKLGTLASASGIGAFFDPGEPRPHIYQNFPFSTFSYPARQAPSGFILKLFVAPRPRAGRRGASQLLFSPSRAADLSRPVFRGLSPTAIHIKSLRDSGTCQRPPPRTNHRPQRRGGSGSMIRPPTNYRRRPSPAGTNMNSRGCKPTGERPMTARPRRGRTGRAGEDGPPAGLILTAGRV